MQRDATMHSRLMRWGSWLVTGGATESTGLVSSVYQLRERVIGSADNLWSARVPFNAIEATATDRAVRAIDADLRRLLGIVYVSHMGHSRERQADQVGVSVKTLHNRLCQADTALKAILEREVEVRARVEAAGERGQFRTLPKGA